MAQQAFEDIAAAVMQAESRGKRYKDDGKTLTTSPKGALGEMQVMPKTIRDPGFGVTPARDKSPDEIARVGQDYLKAMLGKYGDTEKALIAYNWGPGVTDKWIAAGSNPEKLPAETKTYVERVKRFLGETPAVAPNVSRETPAAVPREPLPPSLPPMAAAPDTPAPVAATKTPAPDRLAALGPGYQAALALSFLSDTDEKEDRDIDREPGVAEKYLAEMDAVPRPSSLAQFADVKIRSPFAKPPQPQMLAEGGEVGEEGDKEPTLAEVRLAQTVYPDLPEAQAVYFLRGGNRQSTNYGERLSGNIGARIPLGEDTEAMLMLSGSRSENNPSSSKDMLAMLNQRIGQGDVGATLIRPTDAPSGLYAGSLSGSYPLGEGRISGNFNAMRTPDGQTKMTGYGVGYGGRVGPGNLSVGVSRQGNSGPFSGQLSYRIPIGRAGGSPETGEQAPTAEELEAASRPATVNPMIQRKGEAAKRLAAMRDVNTLPDPRTYSAVSGFLGTNPDEQGFSAMHPDREGIRQAGEAGFYAGTALQVAPIMTGAMKFANLAGSSGGKTTAASQLGALKLSGKTPEPIYTPIPSADAPFVGRLDELVSGLPGPVQKDQFLGMLKGKMRDYDISRAESTLADLPGNAKLSPVDLLNRIKTQYDPSQFKTTVIPPGKPGYFYQSMDNPYFGLSGDGEPLGVIHLSQSLPSDMLQQGNRIKEANLALNHIAATYNFSAEIGPAEKLLNFIKNPGVPISEPTLEKMTAVANDYRKAAEFDSGWNAAKNNMLYPALEKNFFSISNDYAKQLAAAENKSIYDPSVEQRAVGMVMNDVTQKGNQWLSANGFTPINLPNFTTIKGSPVHILNDSGMYNSIVKVFDDAQQGNKDFLKNVQKEAEQAQKMFSNESRGVEQYQGQHPSVKNPPSPISFSRFSEHTTDIPGVGKADGIYVNELQSDLLDDLRKKGVKGGGLKKDEQRLRELETQIGGVTDSTERQAIESKMRNLRTRLYEGMGLNNIPKAGFYELSESFPGMESSPQVIQQLMVKNAVSGAMQMGKQFVAFPGAESAQAQLYKKLEPNLKSVVKDLGPGFELRDVTLRDPDGKQLMHKAIVWGPEAASRVQKKGVPFKDGGAVERQTTDHRRYL